MEHHDASDKKRGEVWQWVVDLKNLQEGTSGPRTLEQQKIFYTSIKKKNRKQVAEQNVKNYSYLCLHIF